MTTVEKNKLIADFMNTEVHIFQWNDKQSLVLGSKEDFNFRYMQHYEPEKDWNDLIPVVEKIESLGCIVEISFSLGTVCKICQVIPTINFVSEDNIPIKAVYDTIVEFIQYFNLNKESNVETSSTKTSQISSKSRNTNLSPGETDWC